MGVTQDLVRSFTTATFDQIPQAAVDITKHAILDDVGIGFMGYAMAAGLSLPMRRRSVRAFQSRR